jgi:hypothetical protein
MLSWCIRSQAGYLRQTMTTHIAMEHTAVEAGHDQNRDTKVTCAWDELCEGRYNYFECLTRIKLQRARYLGRNMYKEILAIELKDRASVISVSCIHSSTSQRTPYSFTCSLKIGVSHRY